HVSPSCFNLLVERDLLPNFANLVHSAVIIARFKDPCMLIIIRRINKRKKWVNDLFTHLCVVG
ncbi:MAG: hypothetical protein IKP84_03985, partial [Prevotella sp.]|nr:hypothetical protein [Prevotella sp.]